MRKLFIMLTSGANEEDPLLGQPITQLQIDYLALKARIAEAKVEETKAQAKIAEAKVEEAKAQAKIAEAKAQARIAEVEGTLSVDKINALIRLREAVP